MFLVKPRRFEYLGRDPCDLNIRNWSRSKGKIYIFLWNKWSKGREQKTTYWHVVSGRVLWKIDVHFHSSMSDYSGLFTKCYTGWVRIDDKSANVSFDIIDIFGKINAKLLLFLLVKKFESLSHVLCYVVWKQTSHSHCYSRLLCFVFCVRLICIKL